MTDQREEFEEDVDDRDIPGSDDAAHEAKEQPQTEPEAPQIDPDDAEEARLFGWKPPDEWQGEKPAGYIDNPRDFIDRVKRSRIFQEMSGRLEKAETTFEERTRKLNEMARKQVERQREQHERELESVRTGMRKAVEDGDTESYDTLQKRQDALLKDAPQPEAETQGEQQPQGPDPVVAEYMGQNAWTQNPLIWREAGEAVNVKLKETNATGVPFGAKEQLEYAERVIREKYPHMFPDKTPTRTTPRVEPGGLAGGKTAKTAWDKVDADGRKQFAAFVKMGTFKDTKEDREEYANEYINL